MEMVSGFTLPGILFVLTLGFGVWLSNAGKPYNGILFNIHKLLALGAVIVTAIQIYNTFITVPPQALSIILIFVSGVCVVALFATGALMSAKKLNHDVMLTIYRIALFLVFIAIAVTVYLFTGMQA